MNTIHSYLIPGLWLAWFAYWRICAADVKVARRHESAGSRAAHLVPLLITAVLLVIRTDPDGGWLFRRFLPPSTANFWIGALLTAIGVAFSCWARAHLGRNWSATVTVKQDHELIRSGPYALVRHPIYTGMLLGLLGTAIAIGQWRGVLALLIAFAALWRKLRLEERWMSETFGDSYQRYRAHTAALIPYLL
ncbi:MAG TPA: isoprenylcysteine carboxylmethyltransferase family protein [Steroidobacteraceae bacterium]